MQAVDVLLSCGHIKTVEIEAAIYSPKPGEEMVCEKHGKQKVIRVSVPYHISQEEVKHDPGQLGIE